MCCIDFILHVLLLIELRYVIGEFSKLVVCYKQLVFDRLKSKTAVDSVPGICIAQAHMQDFEKGGY